MTTVNIRLTTLEDVRRFVNTVTKYDIEIDLCSGRYVVDAKSIMGIFSLDLLSPIGLIAHTENADALFEGIAKFVV